MANENNVIIKFIGDTSELKPAESAFVSLIEKDKALGAEAAKTAEIYRQRGAEVTASATKTSKSLQEIGDAAKTADQAIVSGAAKKALADLQSQVAALQQQLERLTKAQEGSLPSSKKMYDQSNLQSGILAKLRQQIDGYRQAVTEATKTTDISRYNQKIEELTKKVTQATSAGKKGFDDQGNAITKATNLQSNLINGYQLLTKAAAIIPGLGIQGIFLVAFEGIQAAIQALGFFGEGLELNTARAKMLADAQEQLNSELQKTNDITEETINILNNASALRILQLQKEGATSREVRAAELKELQDQLTQYDFLISANGKLATSADEARKRLFDARYGYIKLGSDEKKELEDTVKQYEDSFNDRVKTFQQYSRKVIQNDIATKEEQLKAQKDADEKALHQAQLTADALFNIQKRHLEREIEVDKGEAADKTAGLLRLKALQDQLDAEGRLIDLNRENERRKLREDFAKKNLEYKFDKEKLTQLEGINAAQVSDIEDKASIERIRSLESFNKQRLVILKQLGDDIKAEEAILAADIQNQDKKRFQKFIDDIDKLFKDRENLNAREQDAELSAIQQDYDKGLIDLENYEASRAATIARYAKTNTGNEVARLEAIRLEYVRQYGEISIEVQAIDDKLYKAREDSRRADVAGNKAANKDKEKDDKDSARRRQELEKQIATETLGLLKEISDGYFQNRQEQRQINLQAELDALDLARDIELGNSNLTAQQKADIQDRYRAKERLIKIKGFEADKAAAREQAIASGALAVLNALATVKPFFPAALIASGFAAATTIAQVAIINSRPTPRFRKGKPKGQAVPGSGLAIVDDGGQPEPILRADGSIEFSGSSKDRMTWLGKDDTVFPSLEHFFQSLQAPVLPAAVYDKGQSSRNGEMNYDKLATAIAGKIPQSKSVIVNIDQNGIITLVQEGLNRTEYRNRKNKF